MENNITIEDRINEMYNDISLYKDVNFMKLNDFVNIQGTDLEKEMFANCINKFLTNI